MFQRSRFKCGSHKEFLYMGIHKDGKTKMNTSTTYSPGLGSSSIETTIILWCYLGSIQNRISNTASACDFSVLLNIAGIFRSCSISPSVTIIGKRSSVFSPVMDGNNWYPSGLSSIPYLEIQLSSIQLFLFTYEDDIYGVMSF